MQSLTCVYMHVAPLTHTMWSRQWGILCPIVLYSQRGELRTLDLWFGQWNVWYCATYNDQPLWSGIFQVNVRPPASMGSSVLADTVAEPGNAIHTKHPVRPAPLTNNDASDHGHHCMRRHPRPCNNRLELAGHRLAPNPERHQPNQVWPKIIFATCTPAITANLIPNYPCP